MSSSAAKYKKAPGKREEFDKRGWAGFKKGVADYFRRQESAEANRARRSKVVVTPIEKGDK